MFCAFAYSLFLELTFDFFKSGGGEEMKKKHDGFL